MLAAVAHGQRGGVLTGGDRDTRGLKVFALAAFEGADDHPLGPVLGSALRAADPAGNPADVGASRGCPYVSQLRFPPLRYPRQMSVY